jgi:putative glutamine amidotransferase
VPTSPRFERMSRHPVVGLTTYDAPARWGVWDRRATILPEAYRAAIADAGGSPLAIPVGVDPDAVVERLDGVVLIGGPDIDPVRYGQEPHPMTQEPGAGRDATELAVVDAAERAGIPLLAICRGIEVLNVARGGTLTQHLPDVVGHDLHSPGAGIYGEVTVTVEPGTRLADMVASPAAVRCYHHQAVDVLGRGLVVSARADDDVIEAIEDPDARFVVGVQWHPEVGDDRSLFAGFIEACATRQ